MWQFPTSTMLALLLATIRASAWLAVCPPFSTKLIPARVKALLALAIALPMAPGLTDQVPTFDIAAILSSAVQQVVIGVALGFLTAVLFAAVQAAGDALDLFGGFAIAQAFDPLSATQSSIFGRFFNLIAITLLFASDGHMLVLRGFSLSYRALPLDGTLSMGALSRFLSQGLTEMIVAALQIAGPLIAVLFLADVALGLLNRVAPALNAFALGFPAKIFLTLSLAGFSIAVLPRVLASLIDRAVEMTMTLVGG